MKKILVVGAGLAGAVHARILAESGYSVTVIDRRSHIAGNCFDEVDEQGIRIHRYGPHLFHSSSKKVVDWLSRFTDWTPYEHRVVAKLARGFTVPMPININTINQVFDTAISEEDEAKAFLDSLREKLTVISTAEDYLYSKIGKQLTDLLYRPYSWNMWRMDLAELPPSLVKRLKIRYDNDDRYFPKSHFQALPSDGYTAMFERILDHDLINIELETAFDKSLVGAAYYVFNSMAIDEFFEYRFGQLPYRSVRFHSQYVPSHAAENFTVINYTCFGKFTRETWWHNLPGHAADLGGLRIRTIEEPCDYRENDFERYYPVPTSDGRFRQTYLKYRDLSKAEKKIDFIGRCGTYQYLDMDQVANQSILNSMKWVANDK